MTKKHYLLISILLTLGLAITFMAVNSLPLSASEPSARKIVVFEKNVSDSQREDILGGAGVKKIKRFEQILSADVAELTPSQEARLKKDARIKRVDEDIEVFALGESQSQQVKASKVLSSSQTLPWGINMIDAELVWPSGNMANPIKVGIIDTGISSAHPDLAANIKGGVNTINSRKSWNDDNGHGSHVAGIVAALNNSVGVIGAAPAADLYAIKVLDASGSGYLSDVIEGIQWAVANKIQVINMSLGASQDVQSFHDAVTAAYNAGVVIVAAAGNSGGAVIYPAAYPEAIAVSATDQNNQLASWSSRGPEVDLAAPGVNIYSTYKSTGYATLSGTSMAAPHVAGAAALVLNSAAGSYDLNGNKKWDPAEVRQKLKDKAVDLGAAGPDPLYGYGLVNAYRAVQP